ncbi:arf-GAP with Rho-GAP domain, ANK repeat and PH domain-containing protein 2-like isoform X1 [Corythoichthys intestinalis]|uniref:arf-GAP with Rho-GAP domain, ANK repeat and PH domain-containing protein 2-like isoform X1 n=1 Tax=Corythoichthys intestinalis TaxID=161448 RepID=UPI0025A5E8C8|nr:arf-GAP with Rho-GAP domain, ANK repeat and PH domain-containing protein 2-like isoform X1 [Corythoichthys intestinalis]
MLESPEPGLEVEKWLFTLRLPQYASCLWRGGYRSLEDCADLTDERLRELRVLPTGHRKRILRGLEAVGVQKRREEETRKPPLYPRNIFLDDKKRGGSCQGYRSKEWQASEGGGSRTLPPGSGLGAQMEETGLRNIPASELSSASSTESLPEIREISPEDFAPSPNDVPTEEQGSPPCSMVDNAIYQAQPAVTKGPRPTRSYRLRHRPVPDIPQQDRSEDKDSCVVTDPNPYEDEYSTVEECSGLLPSSSQSVPEYDTVGPADDSAIMVDCDLYSQALRSPVDHLPDISPYACFYGAAEHQVRKMGWLDKLSPHGKCVFQRRWVRFDGEILAYYNSDKEMYSKGMILATAIRQVRTLGDNKFEVVTSLRTFIFRAEKEGERREWMACLQSSARPPARGSGTRRSLRRRVSANKRGVLEVRAYKGRVLVSLAGSKVRLCKTEQDYEAGLAICEVELTAANVRNVDRRVFEINTPFKNFCFVAESEREKLEWIEAVRESITETLCDYEVAEKIWFNEANRSCADCRAEQPEWASLNLGVIICKKCARQHGSLGPSVSKVQSLKLDSSIWSNELVELFLEVGNQKANAFWTAHLPLEEDLNSGASNERRATFVRRKYRERKYRRVLEGLHDSEQLNKALCAAVVTPDVLRTMELVFSGADVMCATGDPTSSTPYLLAQRAGQRLQMEFLHQNRLLDFPTSESTSPFEASPFMDGFLYISPGPGRTPPDRRKGYDTARRWCTLEGGFLTYYETAESPAAVGRVAVADVVSLAVCNVETMTVAGAVFTVEVYCSSGRTLVVGAETQETRRDWIQALTKCLIPPKVESLVRKDSELIGRLLYKEGHDLYHWRTGWFVLSGSVLRFGAIDGEGDEEVLHLKRLQELTVTTQTEGEEKMQVLLMVESGRTVYIHGFNAVDFALWRSAITQAAGNDGKALGDQQLTKNGVPIVVESCIAFVTQYGLCQEGVYQQPGDPNGVSRLLEEFTLDARHVKLRSKERRLEDVTDTLKSFLSQAEDALLTKELYPYWVSALDEEDKSRRVQKYSTFIESLPKTNRATLGALLQHLFRIQQCCHLTGMTSEKLASVFSSCLFQTQGPTPKEMGVVRDLIDNYVTLFNVNEEQVQQMERENSFITRWNDKKDTTFSPAGDLIFEVYLEKRGPENCCLIKVWPSMRSAELAETALSMRNIPFDAADAWTTFEVIENGELERPLHHSEKILEQVLEWSTLDCPSSAFLVLKKFAKAKSEDKAEPKELFKGEHLKFNDGCSKLLSGHKFQDKYVVLRAQKLLLYRDIKTTKAEKVIHLKAAKCYLGLKKKLKPPSSWGFTVYTEKQHWHFCCEERETQVSWVTDIIRMKFGSDLCSDPGDVPLHASSKVGTRLQQNAALGRQVSDRRTSFPDTPKPTGLRRSSVMDPCRPYPQAPPTFRKSSIQPGGGEGKLPLNLLSELNTVLSKSKKVDL